MALSGLRLPIDRINRRLRKLAAIARAIDFKPELLQYAGVTLSTCVDLTPERDSGTIATAQQGQWESRINYIPTNHRLENPTLIVRQGDHLLFMDGKWYHPLKHKLPADKWSRYQELISERQRRITRINREKFISDRVQARGLYKRSWTEAARSLGVKVNASGDVVRSVSRRHPSEAPPKAYAYVQGEKRTITIPVFNPFLEKVYGPLTPTYKPFSGKAILAQAQAQHRPEFKRIVENKVRRLIAQARRV